MIRMCGFSFEESGSSFSGVGWFDISIDGLDEANAGNNMLETSWLGRELKIHCGRNSHLGSRMILATDEAYHKSPQLFGKIPIFVNE